MDKKQIAAVVAIVVIIVACVATYALISGDDDSPDVPEETGITGTYTYNVEAYDREYTKILSGKITYIIESGDVTSMDEGLSINFDSWPTSIDIMFFLTPEIPYSAEEGVPNALINGTVLTEIKNETVTHPNGEEIPVNVYAKPINNANVFYNVDEEGIVYKIIATNDTYDITWMLISIE